MKYVETAHVGAFEGIVAGAVMFAAGITVAFCFTKWIPREYKVLPQVGFLFTFFGYLCSLTQVLVRNIISLVQLHTFLREGFWVVSWSTMFYFGMAFYFTFTRTRNTASTNLMDLEKKSD